MNRSIKLEADHGNSGGGLSGRCARFDYPNSERENSSICAGTCISDGMTTPLATTRAPSQSSKRAPSVNCSSGASGKRNCTSASMTSVWSPTLVTGSTTMLHTASGQRSRESSNLMGARYRPEGGDLRPPRSGGSQRIIALAIIPAPFESPPRVGQQAPHSTRARFGPCLGTIETARLPNRQPQPVLLYTRFPTLGSTLSGKTRGHVRSAPRSTCPLPSWARHGVPQWRGCPRIPQLKRRDRTRPSNRLLSDRPTTIIQTGNRAAY